MSRKCRECGCEIKARPIKIAGFAAKKVYPVYCWPCAKILYDNLSDENSKMLFLQHLSSSGIPNKFKEFFLNNEVVPKDFQRKNFIMVNSLALNKHPLPYLWGQPGVGKTFFGTYIVYKYIEKFNSQAYFLPVSDMINDRYGTIDDPDKLMFKSTTIVIDDLGNHLINNRIISYFFKALSYRMEHGLPTCITSNSNPVKLGKRMASLGSGIDSVMIDALIDRLIELCIPMEMTGESIRVQNFLRRNEHV